MERVGAAGVLLRFRTSGGAHRALATLLECQAPGVLDVVPGATTLLVTHADAAAIDAELLAAVERAGEAEGADPQQGDSPTHVVAVRYDGADLEAVASHAGLHRDDAVALHSSVLYR